MKFHPSPEQAAALFGCGLIIVEDLPDIAAQWLADGQDSASLRLLAGADNDDIRAWWAAVQEEPRVDAGSAEERWPGIWSYEIAAWQAGLRTSREVLRDAVAYLQADDYANRDAAEEAWPLFEYWDELTSCYEPGRTDAEIWADVDAYLHSVS